MPPPGRGTDAPPQGYGAAYYGGSLDISSAAPIAITPGKQIRADLSLPSELLHQISGLVVGAPAGMPANVQLFTPDGQAVPVGIRTNPQNGAFTGFVPSGSYVLKANVAGKGGLVGVGSQPLTVTGDTAGIRLDVGPTAILPIAEHHDRGGLLVRFAPLECGADRIDAEVIAVEALERLAIEGLLPPLLHRGDQ